MLSKKTERLIGGKKQLLTLSGNTKIGTITFEPGKGHVLVKGKNVLHGQVKGATVSKQ